MGRDVEPDGDKFRARSKPEAYLADYFVDTGQFDSDHARTLGFEAYYRDGSWLIGGEYGWQWMDAPVAGDPMFHGGNISVAWLATGETRGYNLVSGYFKAVSPTKTVFEGGPGAVELALNYWRITPLVKWHWMEYLRVELGYGYSELDQFGVVGKTHFVQGRFITGL
jgi:phosphate-selective porin